MLLLAVLHTLYFDLFWARAWGKNPLVVLGVDSELPL